MTVRVARALVVAIALCGVVACASGGSPQRPALQGEALAEALRAGDAAYAQGRAADAVRLYEEVVRGIPENAGVWFKLGNAYARAERPAEAARAYEQSVARDPAHAQAWYNLGVVLTRQAQDAYARGASRAPADQPVGAESRRMWRALDDAVRPGSPTPSTEDAE